MNIGDLFLNLGIKGAEKTVGAIGSARKGMAELGSVSIETKAAIIGAFYALERLVQASNAMGTSLTNFTALTGVSAQNLQKWEYAARQAGVSAGEIDGSLKGVQNSMTNMLLGKGAPEGMKVVADAVGGIDINKVRDVGYMMSKLAQAAQKLPKDVGNNMLKSFGLSEGTISMMRRGLWNESTFAKAPSYSEKEIKMLDKANIAWSNLSNKIQMAIGHFNAMHGGKLVTDIAMITDKIVKMAEAFQKLADKLHVFDLIGKVFEGWGYIFEGISSVIDKMNSGKSEGYVPEYKGGAMGGIEGEGWLPNPPPMENKKTDITVNQNLQFNHDGKEAQKNADSHKKAINGALRQMTVQGQGS